VFLKVLAGVGYATTIATIATSDTINEILNGVFYDINYVGLNAEVGRQGKLGGKSPA